MNDWLKSIQSVGRGFRPGIEIKVISGASDVGKSVILDFESDDFNPFRESLHQMWCSHYVEMYDEPGVLRWFVYDRKPGSATIYQANRVVRHNKDGSYEYIKNRNGTGIKVLDEEDMKEFLFAILSAKRM